MSKSNQSKSMLRQWEMLKLLPQTGSGISAKQLQSTLTDFGFAVSKRTVERDLLALSQVFSLECNAGSKPYGWRWAAGAVEELPDISLTDAISLNLIADTLKPLLPASMTEMLSVKLRKAKEKLVERDDYAWLSKVKYIPAGLPLNPPKLDRQLLHKLQLAVIQEQQIEVKYQKLLDTKPSKLTLHPLAIILRGSVTYIIAKTHTFPDVIRYAAHRFSMVKLLDKKANRSGFELNDYLKSGAMQFGDPSPLTLVANIDDVLFRLLSETPLSEQQQLQKTPSGYQLKAKVTKSWQLKWWVLSKSQHMEVLKPMAYREEIKTALQQSLSQYQ